MVIAKRKQSVDGKWLLKLMNFVRDNYPEYKGELDSVEFVVNTFVCASTDFVDFLLEHNLLTHDEFLELTMVYAKNFQRMEKKHFKRTGIVLRMGNTETGEEYDA